MQRPSRRIFILAAASTAALLSLPRGRAEAGSLLHVWEGRALGAEARVAIASADGARARVLHERIVETLGRIENSLSLYRADSALVRLNRDGALIDPPAELVDVLSAARAVSAASGGAFDPSVQALWDLHAAHFALPGADSSGPSDAAVTGALAHVGFAGVDVGRDRVAMAKSGMRLTLNGIAQGYACDRVRDVLRAEGLGCALVDLGEHRGLGMHPEGRPWRVGVADPRAPWRTIEEIEVGEGAVATSAGLGTPFEPSGRNHHIFDPRTGRSANHYLSVSVRAPTATLADAWSTALSVMPMDEARATLSGRPELKALFVAGDGSRIRVG